MYQSIAYASRKSKSVFVEMSEQSAETMRLLQEGRETQLPQSPKKGSAWLGALHLGSTTLWSNRKHGGSSARAGRAARLR